LAGNHISVSEKQMVLMNETTGNKVSFHQYDSKGNPVSVSKENDQRQSFIWDYNSSLPVAQCNNADSASIAYTSFESDGTGHWTGISSTNVQGSGGLTGDKYYQATGFNIVKSGLSSGSIYVVTYWSKNGAYSINGTQNGYPRTINSVERGGATWTLYEHQVTGQTTVSLSGSGAVDELRLYPQGALMTTFTFYPLIGMSSLCDTGNRVSYYEFDGLGRLKLIRDQNGKVIKMNDYKYASQ